MRVWDLKNSGSSSLLDFTIFNQGAVSYSWYTWAVHIFSGVANRAKTRWSPAKDRRLTESMLQTATSSLLTCYCFATHFIQSKGRKTVPKLMWKWLHSHTRQPSVNRLEGIANTCERIGIWNCIGNNAMIQGQGPASRNWGPRNQTRWSGRHNVTSKYVAVITVCICNLM